MTVILVFVGLFGDGIARAQSAGSLARPVPRGVLALSGTALEDRAAPSTDLVHDLLEAPLNYLGLVVRHVPLDGGPPANVDWSNVRCVLTYFRADEKIPDWVWPWLESAAKERNVRFVHFGAFGGLALAPKRLEAWLAQFGLRYDATEVADPLRIRVKPSQRHAYAYESRPVYERRHLGPALANGTDPKNDVWLTTEVGLKDQRVPIVTGSWGGIALDPWSVRVGSGFGDRRWYIDPIEFFRDALGMARTPAPAPCVLNGRRMFVFHVDGDGFESVSTVARGQICGKVFLDRIVEAYELPMTISIVVASLTSKLDPEQPTPAMKIARRILNHPRVQAASHTVLHPLNWRRRVTPSTPPHTVLWYSSLDGYQHDMVAEVTASIRFINEQLLTGGKRCEVMLWSGNANPPPEAILAATNAGCCNLNGGVFRWDASQDSVGYVPPWGKRVGSAFQVYCGAANENVFEGFFTTMPGAFRHIQQTIVNTGTGRILKPANVYAHFYSAERPERLHQLEALIERWGSKEATAPVFASVYSKAVAAAQGCRIERVSDAVWRFSEFGACPSVRIDDEPRTVDWSASPGIAGFHRIDGSLYLHLSAPDAQVTLVASAPARPHLVEANHAIADFRRDRDSVALKSISLAPRIVVVGGFAAGEALARVVDGARTEIDADADGRVRIELGPGTSQIEVRSR